MQIDELRKLLFDAVDAGDLDALAALCEAHEDAICQAFSNWRTVPEEYRQGRLLGWYAQGLTSVATQMSAARGKPELLQSLLDANAQANHALDEMQKAIIELDQLLGLGNYAEATAKGKEALRRIEGNRSPLVAMIWGRVGQAHFHSSAMQQAQQAFEKSLAESEGCGDIEGQIASRSSLAEVFRYLRRNKESAAQLGKVAELFEQISKPKDAFQTRLRATRIEQGEPLVRIVVQRGDESIELEDVAALDGRVQFIYLRNRPNLGAAMKETAEGERRGSIGDYDGALAAFEKAALMDPHDPSPVYQAGVTFMFLDRPAEAAERFRKTNELAPGWYRCRAYGYIAEQVAEGKLVSPVFGLVLSLDEPGLTAEERVRLAEQGIAVSNLSIFYMALGDAYRQLGRYDDARSIYRQGLELAEEPDVKTQLLVNLAMTLEDPTEQVTLLGEALALGGNWMAVATARIVLSSLPKA